MFRVRAVVGYADYGDLNNFFAVNWINYPRRVHPWLPYFLRTSASRNEKREKKTAKQAT